MRHLVLSQKVSLKHDWMKELGSEVARQQDGEVAQQSKSSQSSQPNPNPDHGRTGKPVVCPQKEASLSQEIETRSFREEAVKHDRTGKTVVCRDTSHVQGASQTRFSHDSTNLNVENETNHDRTGKPVVCRDANPSCNVETYSRYRSRDCGHLQDSRRSLVPTHRPVLQKECARRNRHGQSTPRIEATHPDCRIFSLAERDQEVGQRICSTISKRTDAQRHRQSGCPRDLPQSDGNTSRRRQS